MNSDPKDLWSDAVDVAEWTAVDFESRSSSLPLYDDDQRYRRLAEELGDVWDVGRNVAIDRATRLYIAQLLDSEETLDLRAEANVVVLVPPSSWVAQNRDAWSIPSELPDEDPLDSTDRQVNPATTPTVNELVSVLVDEYDVADSKSDFVKAALRFVGRIEIDD